MERVELAWHTGYSRMNGIGLGHDLVMFAAENNIKTLVVTDTGNLDGYVDLQQNIKWQGLDIKLVMGVDLYVYDDRKVAEKMASSGSLSVLIKNEAGKKNLYKILSEGERKYKNGKDEIQIPLSVLLDNRDGLLIGSGSEGGLLVQSYNLCANSERTLGKFTACEFDKDIYKFLDYMEIPSEGISSDVLDELIQLADYYKIPAVGVCAPHYMRIEEGKAYSVLKDIPWNECNYYHNTEEMLEIFDFLGEEKAYEIVVTNSNLIADMCEAVPAIPDGKMYPKIENQDGVLKEICEKALPLKYEEVTEEIRKRLEWELNAIKISESAFMFIQIKDVMDRLDLKPFEISSRGSVGSSLVAYLCGIGEVDPIAAKLSPYFFFGYKGDKEPDIDLNFGAHIQNLVHEAFWGAPSVGRVIKAGTLGTISERYAEKLLDSYGEEHNRYFWGTNRHDAIDAMTKCVKTRGQHPGGLIMLPKDVEITDICPTTTIYSGGKEVETSAFDYHSIDNIVYKFDALGHSSPEILKKLYDFTGANPSEIKLDNHEVMEMFKVKNDFIPMCAGIPEFTSEFVFEAMKVAKPQRFDDLVKLCSLMHGTDVWLGNAEILIKEGTATISEVLADRDDVYDILCDYGIDEGVAFKIAEDVRKGKVGRGKTDKWDDWKILLHEHEVPNWIIWSCEKIRYMFPKAHSYAYMMSAWRMAWYKLHYPLEFYLVMLNVSHVAGFDPRYMASGKEKMETFVHFLRSDYASDHPFVMDARKTCMLLHDYYDHGFGFKVSSVELPGDELFRIIDDKTIEVDGTRCNRSLDLYDEDVMEFF